MKCAVCSTDNLPGALFCSGCGRKLSDTPVPREQPDQNSDFLEGAEQKSPQPASSEGFMFAPGDMLFDRYRVISCVGKGGMGEVYHVFDTKVEKEFALKILQPELLLNDKKAVDRFMREAAISLEVMHPNIVRMFHVDERYNLHYLVMEYLSGNSLLQWMEQAQRPIPLPIILDMGIQLCDALDYAHKKGIIHRDIKPGNIMVLPGNQVKLLDFGIARLKTYREVTSLGVVVGSIDYMAPERFKDHDKADERTDVYSLGAVLYELLVGRTPYRRFSLPGAYRSDIPAALDTLIDRALRDDPDERIGSARELSETLQKIRGSLHQTRQEKTTVIQQSERVTPPSAQVQIHSKQERKRKFEEALERTRENAIKHAKAGALREAIALWEQFLASYPKAVKIDNVVDELNRLKKNLSQLEAYKQRARQQEAAQDYEGAWQSWNEALELAPQDIETRSKIAEIDSLRNTPRPLESSVFSKSIPQPKPEKSPSVAQTVLPSALPVTHNANQVVQSMPTPSSVSQKPIVIKNRHRKNRLIAAAFVSLVIVVSIWITLESFRVVLPPPTVKSDFVIAQIQYPMRSIQAGTFKMGSAAGERGRDSNEKQHQVTLPRDFYLGVTEVTQAQWKKIMRNNPSHFRGSNLPVETVSWNEVVIFCNKVSEKENLKPCYIISGNQVSWDKTANGYRLPTEAEWEYSCRAGTTTPFSTGEDLTTDQANYNGNFPYGKNPGGIYRAKTVPIDSFQPNTWGLYCMHGNVWEWCWDWFGDYSTENVENPDGLDNGSFRVIRGGSWIGNASSCRSALRDWYAPDYRNAYLGFRLARSVPSGN